MSRLSEEFGLGAQGSVDADVAPKRSSLSQEFGLEAPKPKASGMLRRTIGDGAVTAAKSVIGVGELPVGVANFFTGGAAGKALEDGGVVRFKEAKSMLDGLYSPEQQAINAKVAEADGFVDTGKAMLENPSTIAHTVGESIGPMLAGGAIGRGLGLLTKAPAWLRGAVGEGAVGAAMNSEGVRQQTEDGLLTPEQSALVGGSGFATGLIGAGGAKLAQRLGIGEVDTLLAGGADAAQASSKGVARKVAEGALVEGVLQEAPQSAQEQVAQNLALDRPAGEGVGSALAAGMLAGGVIGGAVGPMGGAPKVQPIPTAENPAPLPVEAPDPDAGVLSRAANQLPTATPEAEAMLALPAPNTLYGDRQGVIQDAAPARNDLLPRAERAQPGLDGVIPPGQQPNQIPAEEVRRQDRVKVAALEQERADRQAQAFVNRVNVEAREALRLREESGEAGPQFAVPPGLDLADKQGYTRWLGEPYRNSVQGLVSQLTKGGDVAYVRNANDVIIGRTASVNPKWWQDMDPSAKPGSVEQAKAIVEKALTGKPLGPKQARFIATMMDMADDMRVDPRQAEENEAILQEVEREINLEARRNSVDYQIGGRQFDLEAQDESELYAYLDGKVEPFSLDELTPEDYDRVYNEVITLDDVSEQTAAAEADGETETDSQGVIYGSDRAASEADSEVSAQQGVQGQGRQATEDSQAVPAGRQPDDFTLESQTEEQLAAQERARLDAEQAEADERTQQEQRTRADSERNDFSLTGSNRTADVGAAAGQTDLLATNTPDPVTAPAVTPERDVDQIPSIQGADIDGDWAQFSAESGTLGIPRADMPQIKAEHRGAMVNFLRARGVRHTESTVPAASLKPTQAEFSRKKVEAAKSYEGGDRAILVSRDGHVLDGHHQWLAKREGGEDVRVIRLSRNINNLLEAVREFPSAGMEQTPATESIPEKAARLQAERTDQRQAQTPATQPDSQVIDNESEPLEQTRANMAGETPERAALIALRDMIEIGTDTMNDGTFPAEINEQALALSERIDQALESDSIADVQTEAAELVAEWLKRGDLQDATAELRSIQRVIEQQKRVSRPTQPAAAPAPQERIEDFGEKLEGARKDYASKLKDAEALDIAESTLTQAWPEPDYQKLLDNGADAWTVGLIRAAREEIPPKPRVAWKLRGWVTKVEALREMSKEVMADPAYAAKMKAEAGKNPVLREFVDKVDLYEAVGHSKSLKGIAVNSGSYTIFNGVKLARPMVKWSVERRVKSGSFGNMPRQLASGDTKAEAIEKFKTIHQKLDAATSKADKAVRFGIFSTRGTTDYFIGKKIGKDVVRIKDGFDSAKEARAYLQDNQEGLESTLAKLKDLPKHRKETNSPRVGADHRANGDVSAEEFAKAFGFRGVQFGNYVEQGRRQQDMNRAYDALMDLAGILNVPARALSLNGELGLSFGARGKGGKNPAAAHYEPGNIVINLTKGNGAGSLAHEWWHALDNYFTRERGERNGRGYASEGDKSPGVRPEVAEAFGQVTRTVNQSGMLARSKSLDTTRTKAYWSTTREMTARAFESYTIEKMRDQGASNDYLANIVSPEYWSAAEGLGIEEGGRYPYPEAAEIPAVRAAYDNFFSVVESKEAEDGNVVLFQRRAVGASGFVPRSDVEQLAIRKMGKGTVSARFRFLDYAQLPPQIKDAAAAQGAKPAEIKAVHWRGITYLVDNRFATTDEAIGAMFHEHYVHFGLRAKYGRGLRLKLGKLLSGVGGLKGVRTLADKQGIDLSEYADGLQGDQNRSLVLMEELMAHMGETTGTLRRTIEEFLGMVRAWLRDNGYADLSRLGVTDLAFELRGARQAAIAADRALASESDQPMFQRARDETNTEAFAKWFGDSKVVDSDGNPLVVYHGTEKAFTKFDKNKTMDSAFWFTSDREALEGGEVGAAGSGDVIPVYLSIKKMAGWDEYDRYGYDELIQQGYDGIKLDDDYIVFEPAQIKSATGNNGSFSPDTADIRFRRTDPGLADRAQDVIDRALGRAQADANDPFAEENRRLREDDKALWTKAKKVFQRQLTPGGLLPKSVFSEKITRDSEFQAVEFDVRHMVGTMDKAIKADYGVKTDDLTEAQIKQLGDALAGKVDPALPENTKVAIVAMRQYIDTLSGEYLSIIQDQIITLQEKAATYGPTLKAANDARKAVNAAIASSDNPAIQNAAEAKKAALSAQVRAKKAMTKAKGDQRAPAKAAYEAAVAAHANAKRALRSALTPELRADMKKADALRAAANEARSSSAEARSEAALYEKIAGNVGAYVNRSYQAFDDPKWFKQVSTDTVNAARQYLIDGYREQGETAAEARRLADVTVNEILKNGTAYDSMGSFITEGKLGAKDLTILIKRKEIAPQIRALLGEYADPRLNFAKSATKMGRLIWNQRFLDRVREMGMGAFLFEGKNRPADATTQIAGEQSDSYAPLNGLWTFPEVAQAFQDSLGKEQMSDLYRTIVRANGMVKLGKTVLSPTTAMRNWQSAMFFSLGNGHFDLTQMRKSLAAFREQVAQTATGDDLTYLRKLKQLGVVYDTPYAGEMTRLMEDARIDDLLTGKASGQFGWFRQAFQAAQGFYSFGDDFWKIIGFENEKAMLIKAGIASADADKMAAERIRNTYPTYSMVGKSVRWLARFPLAGTFVSFPAEIVRTTANMMRLTASDLKSDNPGLRAIGRKRAVGMAMVSGGFYALSAMAAAALGVDDEEEEAVRDLAAPWQTNSTFLFTGRDEDGKLRYFDLSFLDPYGYWKRPLTAMMRDQPWEDAAASGIADMVSPFFGADMVAESIFQVLANKKGSGGQVYMENGDPVDQLTSIADHMRKTLQPGFVSNAERLWLAGTETRRQGSGQPYVMQDEVVSLLGWRASTLDTRTALYYRSFEFTDALRDASKTVNRTLRSANKVSDKDIQESREAAQKQYKEAFTKMSRLISSARDAGMTDREIRQTLKLSNVSAINIGSLLRGTVPELRIGAQSQARAIRQARIMQGEEQAREIARRFRVLREGQ